jgi:hypothetical protein
LETIAGGGDTIGALNQAGVTQDFTHVSTAGAAFLEWLEGKPLPGRRSAPLVQLGEGVRFPSQSMIRQPSS